MNIGNIIGFGVEILIVLVAFFWFYWSTTTSRELCRKFLWFPRTINGKRKWLQFATWRRRYQGYWGGGEWIDVNWGSKEFKCTSHDICQKIDDLEW